MHICFLANADSPNTETWVKYFAYNLGHTISIISLEQTCRNYEGINLYTISESWPRNKLKYIRFLPQIKKLLEQVQPDILVAYRITSYGLIGAFLEFHPFVIAAQGQKIISSGKTRLLKRYGVRYTIPKADLIHAWTSIMARNLEKLGAEPKKILIFPRGINLELFTMRHSNKNDIFRIISTRSLRRDYHLNIIIDAIAMIEKEIRPFKVTILGDGPVRPHLEKQVKALGMQECFEFLGSQDQEKVSVCLADSHIYVSAVKTDGLSMSLIEAMSSGAFPIVVDNESNRLWIENNKNGFLVPPRNRQRMAEAILRSYKDKEVMDVARYRNRAVVNQQFNIHFNMKIFEKFYLDLLEKGPHK